MKIDYYKSTIGAEEIAAVTKVLQSGHLTHGPVVEKFEKAFAEYVGAKHAIAVNSCTSALFLALSSLQIPRGSKVAVPSLTFSASVATILHAGFTPEFVDINTFDYLADIEELPKGVKAGVVVDLFGAAHPLDGETIIHDCAHRLDRGMCLDKKGLYCFSFYPTKNLAGAEGGMICTNDDETAEWLKLARTHGRNHQDTSSWNYTIEFPGWKMNMTDVQAAILIPQLKKLPELDRRRAEIVAKYNKAFGYNRQGLHIYPLLVDERRAFIRALQTVGVETSVHFQPLHLMPPYTQYIRKPLLNTQNIGERLVSLPLYPALTDEEQDYIIERVKELDY